MSKPAPKKLIFAIIFLVLAAGVGTVLMKGRAAKKDQVANLEPKENVREVKPVNVAIQVLTTSTVEETFTLPGTLEAWEDLTLSLEQAGPIVWIGPGEGDRLKAGQEILKIDRKTLEAQQARNQTDYDLKKKQLERANSLLGKQLISQRAYDEAYQAFESARSGLTQTSIALEKSALVTPINGILDQLLVDRGEYGNVGMPAAVVVQIDKLKVLVDVPEKDVTDTRVGQKVTVLSANVNGSTEVGRNGEIIHVGYQADEMTRTYMAKIRIKNNDGYLRPGMIVRVRFIRRIIKDALKVPLYAVIDRDGEKFVFVEEDNTAVERQVRLGPILNGNVVIFGGIQAGEHLIIKGHQLISNGGLVNIVEG